MICTSSHYGKIGLKYICKKIISNYAKSFEQFDEFDI
jgi:hypothetical protein